MNYTPVLFLDMDGTVRKMEPGKFVNGPEDVNVYDEVPDIIKSYKALGWKVVGISNQGGIALGHVSYGKVAAAMQETNRQCSNLFDGMLWCEHHPSAEGDENKCLCRKPRIGNIVVAMQNLHKQGYAVIPAKCLFVGDLEDDRLCAENANMPFMWATNWRAEGPLHAKKD